MRLPEALRQIRRRFCRERGSSPLGRRIVSFYFILMPTVFTLRFIVLWLLFLPLSVRAQVHFVELSAQTLAVPERNFYIASVVDARPQQANIGWVQRGLVNVRTPAALRNGLAPELTTFLQQQLPQRPTDQPLLLRVQQLAISEHTGTFSEQALAQVTLDYLVQQADGYHLALSTTEAVESSGMEVTAQHPKNIAKALQQSLGRLATVQWEAVAGPALTLEEVQNPHGALANETVDYPVLTATTPQPGIYRDFLQFRNDTPETTTVFVVDRKPRTSANWAGTSEILPYAVNIANGQRTALRNVWGFSDGQQIFVLHNRHYFPLERQGNGFGFTGYSLADPGAVGAASVVGGLVGAGIAAAATSGKPTPYVVDMRTGRISDAYTPVSRPQADTTHLIIYRRPGGSKESVAVSVNGQTVGELSGAAYLDVPWTEKQHEVKICLSGGASHCLTLQPTFTGSLYFECSRQPTDPTVPPLTAVTSKVGEFNVKSIRLHQQQDAKKQAAR